MPTGELSKNSRTLSENRIFDKALVSRSEYNKEATTMKHPYSLG